MNPLYLIAEIFPNPEKLVEAKKAFDELVIHTLQEPGCLLYDLVVEEGQDHWMMIEKWQDKQSWEAHMLTQHVQHITAVAPDITAKETKLRFLHQVTTTISN